MRKAKTHFEQVPLKVVRKMALKDAAGKMPSPATDVLVDPPAVKSSARPPATSRIRR